MLRERRHFIAKWTTPIVLSVTLPRHAVATSLAPPLARSVRFRITLDTEVPLGGGADVPLDSPWRIYTATYDIGADELAAGVFSRWLGADAPGADDLQTFEVVTRSAEGITGTVFYVTDTMAQYRGFFTATFV